MIKNQEHLAGIFVKQDGRTVFLGSCFYFVHEEQVLICTADHVVRGWTGEFQIFAKGEMYEAELAFQDPDYDVAFLKPAQLPTEITLRLSEERQVPGNVTLFVYEYSTTEVKNNAFYIVPANRMGNCVRVIQMQETFGNAGKDMLELSFPALRGASGAAVVQITGNDMIAHGMIVANTEHHLLPAHIETVLDQKNQILEEKKYFLPQAAAVNSIHIIECVKAL